MNENWEVQLTGKKGFHSVFEKNRIEKCCIEKFWCGIINFNLKLVTLNILAKIVAASFSPFSIIYSAVIQHQSCEVALEMMTNATELGEGKAIRQCYVQAIHMCY